jgi:hypothetical protein
MHHSGRSCRGNAEVWACCSAVIPGSRQEARPGMTTSQLFFKIESERKPAAQPSRMSSSLRPSLFRSFFTALDATTSPSLA